VLSVLQAEKPNGKMILEIGAGTGWQARTLAAHGYMVQALDTASSNYAASRIWPIVEYDGHHIPFPDGYFDIIFSSNVLEHIPHLYEFQTELKRVLKPDGVAIHVVPSGWWRFWTNVTHYPFMLKTLVTMILFAGEHAPRHQNEYRTYRTISSHVSSHIKNNLTIKAIFPCRHGEIGNAVSEIYLFSGPRWRGIFESTGWQIKRHFANNLFYTGNAIFGSVIPIQLRKCLSYILGSVCHIFVLTKA